MGRILKYFRSTGTCYWAGIAWDGHNLYYGTNVCWASPAGQRSMIYMVNPETGTAIDSFPPPSGNINGLAYNKGRLWYCDDNSRYIFEIDTAGNIISEFPAYGRLLTGLAIAKGYLWAVDMEGINGPRIYEIDIGLAPAIPQKFSAQAFGKNVHITWDPSASPDVQWYKIYRSLSDNSTTAVLLDSVSADTTAYTDTTAPNGYYTYYWVSAVDSEGVESHVSSFAQAFAMPYLKYKLFQNYPNPFNGTTTIEFEIPPSSSYMGDSSGLTSHVKITLYDVLGRKVTTIFDGEAMAGDRTVTFDGSRLPSGVYFYSMRVGTFVQTKKLVIVR